MAPRASTSKEEGKKRTRATGRVVIPLSPHGPFSSGKSKNFATRSGGKSIVEDEAKKKVERKDGEDDEDLPEFRPSKKNKSS
jgi:hypothetical protein